MQELWLATGNKGKMAEFKNLLEPLKDFLLHSQEELSYYSSPPETGKTFLDNARIKAKSLKAVKPGVWVMADDSGLEIDGLGGMPGVFSARYAGDKARDSENRAKALKMLQIRSPMNRKAQFHCTLVAFNPQGEEIIIEGLMKGQISQKEQGSQGFGYDPIFIPEGQTQTLAELGLAFKNQHSHRALACQQLIAHILKN